MALGQTVTTMRGIMAVLAPLTGTRATGTARVRSTTGGDIALQKNTHAAPIILSTTGKGQIARDKLVMVAETVTVTPGGTAVPITSLLGGKRHNLKAGSKLRWDPELVGIEAVSDLEGAMEGAVDAAGDAHVKQILAYEELGNAALAAQYWAAQAADNAPTIIVCWTGSGEATRRGKGVWTRPDTWIAYVVVSRQDGAIERGYEGLNLLDLVEAYLGDRAAVDGMHFSDPPIAITGRRRHSVSPTAFVYVVSFRTVGAVVRIDTRLAEGRTTAGPLEPWKSTGFELKTATTPEFPLLEGATYAHEEPEEES